MARKRRPARTWPPIAALALLAGAAEPEAFEVALWANDDSVETLAEVIATESHPCGATAIVRLSRMPAYREKEGALGTELVVETGDDGGEAARWSVPVDYEPLALRGGELQVAHRGMRLWIGRDGALSRDVSGADLPTGERLACPAPAAHPDSEYAICARFRDLDSGRPRLLQYEGSCT